MKELKLSLPRRGDAVLLPGESNVVRFSTTGDFFSGLSNQGWGGSNGHQAADQSLARGMIYWPQLDTRREVNSYTRTEIMRKCRYLYANVGLPRRLIKGLSRMVAGTGLMPRQKTLDREWNKLADRRMDAVYSSAKVYDLGGRLTGYRSQRVKLKLRYRDSDCFTVFTRGPAGRATTALYEAHQVGSGRVAEGEVDRVFDGIVVDPSQNNRPVSIRFLGDNGQQVDIPAASVAHLVDPESAGQSRGLSILSAAAPHLQDRTEVHSAFKGSIKRAAQVGYYIGAAKDTVSTQLPRPGASSDRRTVTTASGKKVNLDTVYSGNGGEVPELDPGRELKMLLDERPHPNTQAFLDEVVRDISLSVDLAPEVLYNVVKLGGANMRYVMADAQSYIETEQQTLVDTDLGLEHIWLLADEILSGRLPPCPDPEWWKHDWITPARLTVDIGRDGKLHLEQLKSAALTFRRFYGWQGLDGLDELDEWLNEMAYVIAGCKARPELSDEKMRNFVLAALYQRVGLASTLDDPAPAKPAPGEDDPPSGSDKEDAE